MTHMPPPASMMDSTTLFIWLIAFSTLFALAGIVYARRRRDSLEDYVAARHSQGLIATVLTLMASSLGAWILFSPPQAATWGGLAAVTGYALGAMSPRLAMIPLGRRMRELIPRGHTLTEFVIARYGRPMYALSLLIMLFYMFIALTAEITAMSKLISLIAPLPLWAPAAVVMGAALIYTAYGGLRTSIFTDKVQMVVIVPLLCVLVYLGWRAAGGLAPTLDGLRERAPQLLNLSNPMGIKTGLTFFVAILLTGLFHQGNWQRVYAARDDRAMRRGFLLGGLLVAPFIFIMGLFGLAFMALTPEGDSSVALFTLVLRDAPAWFLIALIPLGLALVMSSADTVISAVSSLIAVDARRLAPNVSTAVLMRLSRWLIFLLAIPVLIVAAQGYSVLYLFLLADLLCSAAAFPVFYGLFNKRYDGRTATVATAGGLAAGLAVFPLPGAPLDSLLASFLLAALAPVALTVALTGLMRWLGRRRPEYDFSLLQASIRSLDP